MQVFSVFDLYFIGGMSSFTLILMISAFLYRIMPYQRPSHCLLGILQYYGQVFDCSQMAVMNDCIMLIQNPGENYGLFVSSPLRPDFNVAYNVTRFEEIKECFCETYKGIMKGYSERPEKVLNKILQSK